MFRHPKNLNALSQRVLRPALLGTLAVSAVWQGALSALLVFARNATLKTLYFIKDETSPDVQFLASGYAQFCGLSAVICALSMFLTGRGHKAGPWIGLVLGIWWTISGSTVTAAKVQIFVCDLVH